MKPATPLRAENGLKLAVSWEQRCQQFHFVAVIHPHWFHRFQTRQPTGVLWGLWRSSARKTRPAGMDSGPNREKVRPAAEKALISGSFGGAGRTFSRVCADGGEQGEFCRARGA